MSNTVTLSERYVKTAAKRAQELGVTTEAYIESLIDAATLPFDEILAPVREGFRKGKVTEEELDAAVAEARKAIHDKAQRKARK